MLWYLLRTPTSMYGIHSCYSDVQVWWYSFWMQFETCFRNVLSITWVNCVLVLSILSCLRFRFVSFRFVSFRFLVLTSSTYSQQVSRVLFTLDHTETHTTVARTPLVEGSARRRDLYLTTQTLYKTNIHATCGIRTRDPSKRLAADRAATGSGV
jgi:hypothetical protein